MRPDTTELCYLTIGEASGLLSSRKLSPVELTRAFLDRIDRLDGVVQAYITVLGDEAMGEARRAEAEILRGEYKGPLHGIPIALKDLYDTEEVRTTAGSRVMSDRVPTADATTTARLKAAGSILLGKLTMHEFGLGDLDATSGFPMARNPWNLEHTPGGSSSGSGAAVAAGLCMAALGSCTGGSIRGPASHCGIVGLKATYGRISRAGAVPMSWTMDHCGPMTWNVEDTATMLQATAGHDFGDPASSPLPVPDYSKSLVEDVEGLRIGVPRHFFFADDPQINRETLATVETALSALESLGAHVEEVTVPSLQYARAVHAVIMFSEAFAYHRPNLLARPDDFGVGARSQFRVGGLFSSSDYLRAQRVRNVLKGEFARTLEDVDVIVSPTRPQPAPRFDQVEEMTISGLVSFTNPYNLTGLPAISVPCGFTSDGLPVGLQIAGRPYDEPTVLRAAFAYQQHARLFEKRPQI